jgi:hypothetical protein
MRISGANSAQHYDYKNLFKKTTKKTVCECVCVSQNPLSDVATVMVCGHFWKTNLWPLSGIKARFLGCPAPWSRHMPTALSQIPQMGKY